jgi:ABC-2 type transport system permease protein
VLTIALAQTALIVGLAVARGAEFSTSASGVLWFVGATALLTLTVYGIAETLALRIGRQEAYGPLIPAVGVTPWFLSGALFPITVLPQGIRWLSLALPWTHAVALMRYGIYRGVDPGLHAIWGTSDAVGAALSFAVLVAWAALTLSIAVRTFDRAVTS